jgi:predicted DCC family thiol-disulfide oxidoreductase YuxK
MESEYPIILFDGVCNLCNGAVQFIIKRDPEARFKLAALQSETGQALLDQHGFTTESFETIVLIEGSTVYTHSTAALHIVRHLSGMWPILFGLIGIPKPLRDGIYLWISRNRYRWFGKRDSCMIPSPELRSRFLGT